jgi:hypothetical protein
MKELYMTRLKSGCHLLSPVFRAINTILLLPKLRRHTFLSIMLHLLLLALVNGETSTALFYNMARYHRLSTSRLQATSLNQLLRRDMALSQLAITKGVSLSIEAVQTAAGPERVQRLDIDLTNPRIRLGVVQADDRLVSPDEPLSSMANRTHALAGINGDYFQIKGPGRPIGMVVRDGQLLQTPTNDSFYAVLGVTPSGRLTIGPEFFDGRITDGAASYTLHEVNIYSDIRKGLILITPDLGAPLSVVGETVALLQPVANSAGTFTVQSVRTDLAWLPALSGQDALLGVGADGYWLTSHLHPHDRIHVTEHLSPHSNLVQAVGGGPILLKQGRLYDDLHTPVPNETFIRDPLTAIGVTRDGSHAILAVFNGREADAAHSQGLTHLEAAYYMRQHGADSAMLFDSGGSSELVARLPRRGQVSVINTPSDGAERPVANGLFIYAIDPPPPAPLKFGLAYKLRYMYPEFRP